MDELKRLGDIFAIDICAYAVMSNHYHLALHINKKQVDGWKEKQVIKRWAALAHPCALRH